MPGASQSIWETASKERGAMFCVRAFARRSCRCSRCAVRAVCGGTPRGTPRGQQPKNGWCLFPAAPDTPARRVIRIIRIWHLCATLPPAWHRSLPAAPPDTPAARRVIRIIRIIRSYGGGWHLCATLPRYLPGIEASRPRHLQA